METFTVLAGIRSQGATRDLALSALPNAPVQPHVERRVWLPRITVTRLSLPVPRLKRPTQVPSC